MGRSTEGLTEGWQAPRKWTGNEVQRLTKLADEQNGDGEAEKEQRNGNVMQGVGLRGRRMGGQW